MFASFKTSSLLTVSDAADEEDAFPAALDAGLPPETLELDFVDSPPEESSVAEDAGVSGSDPEPESLPQAKSPKESVKTPAHDKIGKKPVLFMRLNIYPRQNSVCNILNTNFRKPFK